MAAYKVLVCGGREFADAHLVSVVLGSRHDDRGIRSVVHGDALGADQLADQWARRNHVPCVRYPADWVRWGNAAGPIRNQLMLDKEPDIDLVIAFKGGRGTRDMLDRAQRKGLSLAIVGRWDHGLSLFGSAECAEHAHG